MQTLKEAFNFGVLSLKSVSPSPQLDARLLLEYMLDLKHLAFTNPDFKLQDEDVKKFHSLIQRRINGEPIAYIVGKKEFFGLEFEVSPSVLIPRPDSEILVEEALSILKNNNFKTIADVCTGSGCLVISILSKMTQIEGVGYDISPLAINIAENNKKKLLQNPKLNFKIEDVLSNNFHLNAEMIISNPPYIPQKDIEELDVSVKNFEPILALDGGEDGLIFYRKLAEKCKNSKFVLLEIGVNMESSVEEIFVKFGYTLLDKKPDLSGIIRVLIFKR
jgi:release factor glutamine methyltransferase